MTARSAIGIVLAAVLAFEACDAPEGATGPSPSEPGKVGFWTNAERFGRIEVWLEGSTLGKLTHYYDTEPGCFNISGAILVAERPPGSYDYRAESSLGKTWSGTLRIPAGDCVMRRLDCGTNRNCTSDSGVTDPPPPNSARGCARDLRYKLDRPRPRAHAAYDILFRNTCSFSVTVRVSMSLFEDGYRVGLRRDSVVLEPNRDTWLCSAPDGFTACGRWEDDQGRYIGGTTGRIDMRYDYNTCLMTERCYYPNYP